MLFDSETVQYVKIEVLTPLSQYFLGYIYTVDVHLWAGIRSEGTSSHCYILQGHFIGIFKIKSCIFIIDCSLPSVKLKILLD